MTRVSVPRIPRRSLPGAIVFLLLASAMAVSDTVTLEDGRVYEGKIVAELNDRIRIDTLVSNTRATLSLYREDIQRIERKPLPEGFFEREEEPAPRVSDPARFSPGSRPYLEVPIVGRFGVQVVPDGVRRCLAYATRHGIEDVVFTVDSQGGDLVAASEIADLLRKYEDRLRFHAVIRDAVGVAVAVPLHCENRFMRPGAHLGGVLLIFTDTPYEGDPDVLRSEIAFAVSQTAAKHGWSAPLVRAMIDPAESVVAWREGSEVVTGVRAPSGVGRSKIIVENGPDDVLTLSRSQAVEVGMARAFDGPVERLGTLLEADGWILESDYGSRTMVAAAREQRTRLAKAEARANDKIARLVKKRDKTQASIERNLTLAEQWDPQNEPRESYSSYEAYRDEWTRYWGPASGPEMDKEAKRRWRDRTDASLMALSRALKCVKEMKRLDRKAVDLGVDPLYEEGRLDEMEEDIKLKATWLSRERNRRFR